jgi:hypothetical protein
VDANVAVPFASLCLRHQNPDFSSHNQLKGSCEGWRWRLIEVLVRRISGNSLISVRLQPAALSRSDASYF